MKTKNVKITLVLLILATTLLLTYLPPAYASPTNYDVKLYFHKVSSKTLYGSTTTTTIMNTTSTGYFQSTNQTISVVCSTNDSYYTLATFYLYPKLAGSLTIPSQTALPLKLYLKADKSVDDITIRTNLNKTSSTDGSTSEIATTSTYGTTSLSTSVALKSVSGPVIGSDVTVESGYYLVLKIEVKTTASAPVNVTLYYDTSSCPSRIDRLTVTDHIQVTGISTTQDEYKWDEPITVTITVTDAFGLYDIASVKFGFNPVGTSTIYPSSSYATATRSTGTDTDYQGTYTYTYTHNSTDDVDTEWWLKAYPVDNSGNTGATYTASSKIYVKGPGGTEPPPEGGTSPIEWLTTLPPELLMLLGVALILLVVCIIIGVYLSRRK